MQSPHPVGILCNDLHLSETAPLARSVEVSWFAAQARPLKQLAALAKKHDVPIFCAGDVFDRWSCSPALVNFALDHLPEMYAVPGQHDLPNHSYERLEESVFRTMMKVGRIHALEPNYPVTQDGWEIYGFPWNFPVVPPSFNDKKNPKKLAVVHAYIWANKKTGFPGAKVEQTVGAYTKALKGYDVACFGDNHLQFSGIFAGNCLVTNLGGFQRRTIDQIDHKPAVGILMSDGEVDVHNLDCSEDLFLPREEAVKIEADSLRVRQFVHDLTTLGGSDLDFREAVEHYLTTNPPSPAAEAIIREELSQ